MREKFLKCENSSRLFPVQAVLTTLLQPVSKAIQQVQAFREQNRTSPHFNHLSAVSESVPALGWVAMVRLEMRFCVCVCGARETSPSLILSSLSGERRFLG